MSRPIRALAGDESRTGSGVALAAGSSASMQFGASVGALTFPVLGPVGVVSIRQLFVAAIYLLLARPRLRAFTRSQWLLVSALALVFSVMGICVYAAFERIRTGLTVTLEFLGALGVAIATSRRLIDIGCAVLSSVVPYTLDLMALRRLTPGLFSTLTSLHPVWAVLLGWVVLHQALSPVELLGVALVVASNVIVAGAAVRRSRAKRGL